ncbi:E3 ubiquitin-protein ligase lubel-like isoform X2 [Physella acuta]|uniref:E3 ubiquitin-protein ligase lubel-like isoform X2 n=1 Tax=Physella acuta TaxID=109671 RepID=UPI0027DD10E7|nr:E3 ubiquitin-protein ligase lubel-like isoform X2 [Physella acuta]
MSGMLGKIGKVANSLVNSMMAGREAPRNQIEATGENQDDLEPLPSIVKDYRAALVNSIYHGQNTDEIIKNLVELACPAFDNKYAALRARDLLTSNNQSIQELKNILNGAVFIIKYAKHLIKDPDKRREQWRVIPFNNTYYQKKIKPLKGCEKILEQMGYTQRVENGLSFPLGHEPDRTLVVSIIADLMILKQEIREYILDKHPHPHLIKEMLPQQTQDELLAFQISELKFEDDETSENTAQMSIIDFESMAPARPSAVQQQEHNNNIEQLKLLENGVAAPEQEKETSQLNDANVEPPAVQEVISEGIQDLVLVGEQSDAVPVLSCGDGRHSSSSSKRFLCDVCGEEAAVFCLQCKNKPLCDKCNSNWHKHPQRQNHRTESISSLASLASDSSLHVVYDGKYGVSSEANVYRAKLSKTQQTYPVSQHQQIRQTHPETQAANLPDLESLGLMGQEFGPANQRAQLSQHQLSQQELDYQQLDYQRFQTMQYAHRVPYQGPRIINAGASPQLYPSTMYAQGHQDARILDSRICYPPNTPTGQQDARILDSRICYPPNTPTGQQDARILDSRICYPPNTPTGQQDARTLDSRICYPPNTPRDLSMWQRQPIPHHLLTNENMPAYITQQIADHQRKSQLPPNHYNTLLQSPAGGDLAPSYSPAVLQYPTTMHSYLPDHQRTYSSQLNHLNTELTKSPMHISQSNPSFNSQHYTMYATNLNSNAVPNMHPSYHDPTNYRMRPSVSSSSVSSSSLHSTSDHTTRMHRLLQVPDIQKRISKCENYIEDLGDDISDLDKKINALMLEQDDFCRSEEFIELHKRKQMCMKEKMAFENYRKELDEETTLVKSSSFPQEMRTQEILFPPDIDKSLYMKKKPGHNSSQLTMSHDNTQFAPGSATSPLHAAGEPAQMKATEERAVNQSAVCQSAVCQSRIPVEDSSTELEEKLALIHLPPPDLPPRARNETVLTKILPAPDRLTNMTTIKQWQCEHCTFLNEASSHACSMCFKTSVNPTLVSISDPEDNGEETLVTDESREPSFGDEAYMRLLMEDDKTKEKLTNYTDPDQTHVVGKRIMGSQEQVMKEKKKAQQEYLEKNSSAVKQAPASQVRAKSLSPTPAKSPYGIGARLLESSLKDSIGAKLKGSIPKDGLDAMSRESSPKESSPKPEMYTSELGSSSEFHTPPSESSPSPSHVETTSAQSAVGKVKESESSGRSSLEDTLARYNEQKLMDTLQNEGAEFAKLIKMADQAGYQVEAVQIASVLCQRQKMSPLEWLEKNWKKNVERVIAFASEIGKKQECNSVGELTEAEAEAAYIKCQGNMKEAAQLCAETRTKLYEYLNECGNFPREEILHSMYICAGHQENAEVHLQTGNLQHYVNHIWAEKEMSTSANPFVFTDFSNPEVCHSYSTSVITHGDFQKMIKDRSIPVERRIRLILVEGALKSWGRADLVIKILDSELENENIALEDVVEAVRNCQDKTSALAYLQQQCEICLTNFPMSKIRNLNFCQCKMCAECLYGNFEIAIREKHVHHWTCPLCSLPDLNDTDVASDYLQFLTLLLRPFIDPELLNLFETKVRDWHLQKDPNFRWCAHCAEGFLADNQNGQLRMTCPMCNAKTCFSCKREWEDQHEGLTCEQFAQWKIDNDPNNQSVGLAKHLDENGIDCPTCKMRFALAKGGCMHFKCPNCGHEFCSGCNEPYHQKNFCHKYKGCKKLGLHCHCPRDCFSYLRDYSVQKLQTLLKQNKVLFNVKIPEDQLDANHCPVMEQKEFDLMRKDEKCGKETVEGQAGLCELHYKEYLVDIINRHRLDPLLLMSKDEMLTLMKRHDLPVPAALATEAQETYIASLSKIIKEKLPLRR